MRYSQKDFHKKVLGKSGEIKAEKFLKEQGYKILDKNYKTLIGEIDIIAEDKSGLVFVEVKTRLSDKFGRPSEAVNKEKREKYFKVAKEYLVKNYGTTDVNCRFDVIEIENGEINHITGAFFA